MIDLFKFLKAKRNILELSDAQGERKEGGGMKTEFLDGIVFEENPIENEVPDSVVVYDLNGNEVEE